MSCRMHGMVVMAARVFTKTSGSLILCIMILLITGVKNNSNYKAQRCTCVMAENAYFFHFTLINKLHFVL